MGEQPFFIDDGEQIDERLPWAVHGGKLVHKLFGHITLRKTQQHRFGTNGADGQLEATERQGAFSGIIRLCELQKGLIGKMADQPLESLLAEGAF